jgi:hypothetical protein
MNPRLSDYALCAVLSLAQAILVLVILKKGAVRRWPFLLALCLFDLAENALLAAHTGSAHYRQYFYIYWYGNWSRALLSLGVIWDIAKAIPCLKYVPKRIGLVLMAFGLAVTAGSVLLTTTHHPNVIYPQTAQVLMVRECVTVAWLCFALSLLGSISSLRLGWPKDPLSIAGGAIIWGLADMHAAHLISWWPQHGHLIDQIQIAVEIAVLLSWSVTLRRPSLPDAPLSDSALHVVYELFEEQPLT